MRLVREVLINGQRLKLDLADNLLKRAMGLSYRKNIKDDEGMLFVFRKPARRIFWMFGMRFRIDVVWINGSVVLGVQKNISPYKVFGFLNIYSSPSPADTVLELKSGAIDRLGIRVGDKILVNL